ncbi:MAG TPA: DUF1206 domain-containing protein [Mycobacterium sp.]|jgi:hypothetical protein
MTADPDDPRKPDCPTDLTVSGGPVLTPLGIAGYVGKGLMLAGAGILVIVATFTTDPAKSSGIDGAVKTFGAPPFGKVLLIVAALGFAAYGLYSFARSRMPDVNVRGEGSL